MLIDDDIGEHFADLLKDANMTPMQHLFLQQQFKSARVKDPRGMRWHPAMISFALLIKTSSPHTLHDIRQSGVIRLPGDRTLFEYIHATTREEGVFKEKLNTIGEKVSSFEKTHQKLHNLLMDEIYICQKLVFRKSDGALVGSVKLIKLKPN